MYNSSDTIFAPLTIKGKCSVYAIRISGTKAATCLEVLGIKKVLKHRQATLCNLKDKNGLNLDEALCIYFQAPNSFTGEDVCELNLHCSNYIINEVFKILLSIEGVRLATNGEFSRRAFLNNKLDLIQAEAIVDLIEAETKTQHKQAIEQLKGKNSKFFEELRTEILNILSNLEAIIDFPEDDVDFTFLESIQDKINCIKNKIEKVLDDNKVGEKIKNGFNISILGEPNAGKSSLLNYLAKKDLAIVSNIAGTTRDIIQIELDIDGYPVVLYDTAGIRETESVIEQEGVKRAIKNANEADLKIILIDSNNINISTNIFDLVDKNSIIVLNKIDDTTEKNISFLKDKFSENTVVEISILQQKNLDILIEKIKKFLEINFTPYSGTNITHERYRIELLKSLENLLEIDFNLPIEIIAEHIRSTAFCIGKITGIINTEEVLDNIFSKFCIGK